MKVTHEATYTQEVLGTYPAPPLALGGGRALFRNNNQLFFLEAGTMNHVDWSLPDQFLEDEYNLAWFFSEERVGFLCNTHLALWDMIGEPMIVPIRNPLQSPQPNLLRQPFQVRCIPGQQAAIVVLGEGSAHIKTDTVRRLEWTEAGAQWVGESMQLLWSDIPYDRTLVSNVEAIPPFIRAFDILPDGTLIVHHTGSRFLGDGGSARYGMDWSLLLTWDLRTGRAQLIEPVETGYGMMSRQIVLIKPLSGNTVHVYSYAGELIDSFSFTPRFVNHDKDRVIDAFEGSDMWTRSTTAIHHCRLDFVV